jgi:hypothetical protein
MYGSRPGCPSSRERVGHGRNENRVLFSRR